MSDTYATNHARLSSVADEHGLILNPDSTRVQKVVGLMAANYDTIQEWVCPCKQTNKPPVQGKDKTCPCPEWLDEIADAGHCHCKLFFSPEQATAPE